MVDPLEGVLRQRNQGLKGSYFIPLVGLPGKVLRRLGLTNVLFRSKIIYWYHGISKKITTR